MTPEDEFSEVWDYLHMTPEEKASLELLDGLSLKHEDISAANVALDQAVLCEHGPARSATIKEAGNKLKAALMVHGMAYDAATKLVNAAIACWDTAITKLPASAAEPAPKPASVNQRKLAVEADAAMAELIASRKSGAPRQETQQKASALRDAITVRDRSPFREGYRHAEEVKRQTRRNPTQQSER